MSAQGYASRLSPHGYKGRLNLKSRPDPPVALLYKSRILAEKIRKAHRVVVHTGAGISTAAGICDFRGPDGIWTRQAKQKPVGGETRFEEAVPTLTHIAIKRLHQQGMIKHVVSQNVDGLHLRSGLDRSALSELHGNLFVNWCPSCEVEFTRDSEVQSVGYKGLGKFCECGEELTDKALDWDDNLPKWDLESAQRESEYADLCLVVGTSCQMNPAGVLPFEGLEAVMINLSETRFDSKCSMVIRGGCDVVFAVVMKELGIEVGGWERWVKLLVGKGTVGIVWDGEEQKMRLEGLNIWWKQENGALVEGNGEGYEPVGGWTEGMELVCEDVKWDGEEDQSEKRKGKVKVWEIQYDAKVDEIVGDLEQKARGKKRKRQSAGEAWFVKANRRGWMMCCLCRKELRSGAGRRNQHVEECPGASLPMLVDGTKK